MISYGVGGRRLLRGGIEYGGGHNNWTWTVSAGQGRLADESFLSARRQAKPKARERDRDRDTRSERKCGGDDRQMTAS